MGRSQHEQITRKSDLPEGVLYNEISTKCEYRGSRSTMEILNILELVNLQP